MAARNTSETLFGASRELRSTTCLYAVMVAMAGFGCQEPTQVRLHVRTDVPYAPNRTLAFSTTESPSDLDVLVDHPWGPDGDIGTMVIVPEGDRNGKLRVRVVMGVTRDASECSEKDAAGCIIARRRLRFLEHRTVELPVGLYAVCEGVPCDEDTTCDALGRCVSSEVDPLECIEPDAPGCKPEDAAGSAIILSGINQPHIVDAPDQRGQHGELFEYAFATDSGENVHWSKTFGPDDASVDPINGILTWQIPPDLPDESFYMGVRAENSEGVDYDTFILTVGHGEIVYIGPNEANTNTRQAFVSHSDQPGTTFIYRDGTYTDDNQIIDGDINGSGSWAQQPPNGDESRYTTVMAENPGQVTFRDSIQIQYAPGTGTAYHHIAIKGFFVQGVPGENNGHISCIADRYDLTSIPHHIKFMYNGVWSEGPDPISYGSCHDGLIEGNYAFGGGRYKYSTWHGERVVFRRNVARYDRTNNEQGDPKGGFSFSSSHQSIGQNNIMIDSDHPEFWTQGSHAGAFGSQVDSGDSDTAFYKSILINSDMSLGMCDRQSDGPCYMDVKDMVAWDVRTAAALLQTRGRALFENMTIGNVMPNAYYVSSPFTGPYFDGWNDSGYGVRGMLNSLIHNTQDGNLFYGFQIQQQSVYGDQTFGVNFLNLSETPGQLNVQDSDINNLSTHDPIYDQGLNPNGALRYLVRIEEGAPLYHGGLDGETIGADVTTLQGLSGTMYGDAGYNDELDIPMWPIPWEHIIKEKMASYTYTGPLYTAGNGTLSPVPTGESGTLSGKRGFADDGESLTNYVWGTLGNTVPPMDVRAVSLKPGDLTLMWQMPAQATLVHLTGYRIYRKIANGPDELLITIESPGANMVTLRNVLPGQNEYYVTALSDTHGESGYSYAVMVSVL